jgi:hypothetical protein
VTVVELVTLTTLSTALPKRRATAHAETVKAKFAAQTTTYCLTSPPQPQYVVFCAGAWEFPGFKGTR